MNDKSQTNVTLSLIAEHAPSQKYSVEAFKTYDIVHLEFGPESDYDIDFYLYGGEFSECDIQASLRSKQDAFFWHMPFESYGYETPMDLIKAAQNAMITLLTKTTRIVQKKKLLLWNFVCEYTNDNTTWETLYAMGYLRLNPQYKVPNIKTKKKIYIGQPFNTA